ncbi:hypothetical protein AKJ09_04444 [Labilithrix luteola]|uniref:Uncharacterized protein n=1 Tax=Labilithrix luteola TaxID=1391654 RepID=A0A0K1PW85_9BACT|nr:hypothetical protein AKJ09_04444 [Labilithrix luteola]
MSVVRRLLPPCSDVGANNEAHPEFVGGGKQRCFDWALLRAVPIVLRQEVVMARSAAETLPTSR